MGIPESQLDTWSHQGSVTQSKNTYATIRKALERKDARYAERDYEIFLQGSYGNDTNIWAESDVDVVIQLNYAFQYGTNELSKEEQASFESKFQESEYGLSQFRKDVVSILSTEYGSDVKPGEKAIKVQAGGSRRNADVIAAIEYRKYHPFVDLGHQNYTSGISFDTASGDQIINYPKLHSTNLTTKHQLTGRWFKPTVRIFKNMRSWLVNNSRIEKGDAPSYYIEGLVYNVPNDQFGRSYQATVSNCLDWLAKNSRDKWVCANEMYKLLHPTSHVTWRDDKCVAFINAAIAMWNEW